MSDIATLLTAVRGLRLPRPKLTPSEFAQRIRAKFSDDSAFKQAIKELSAPGAYSASEIKEIYNLVLDRNQRFAAKASKKKILDDLVEEREIMLSNDQARAVISAHSST
jgi:hypothetical protein